MMEKCIRPSVEFAGNGKVVEFWINVRISSVVVFIGTVKWTNVDGKGCVMWSIGLLSVFVGSSWWLAVLLAVLVGGIL